MKNNLKTVLGVIGYLFCLAGMTVGAGMSIFYFLVQQLAAFESGFPMNTARF